MNEAGQHLGRKHDSDSPNYDKSLAAKAHKDLQNNAHPWYSTEIKVEFPVKKSFTTWMDNNKRYL